MSSLPPFRPCVPKAAARCSACHALYGEPVDTLVRSPRLIRVQRAPPQDRGDVRDAELLRSNALTCLIIHRMPGPKGGICVLPDF
jgi:hypothetical protein